MSSPAPIDPVPIRPRSAGVEELAAEARYHRQRYDLYRAKAYSMRPTSGTRMRELERTCAAAEARLAAARDRM